MVRCRPSPPTRREMIAAGSGGPPFGGGRRASHRETAARHPIHLNYWLFDCRPPCRSRAITCIISAGWFRTSTAIGAVQPALARWAGPPPWPESLRCQCNRPKSTLSPAISDPPRLTGQSNPGYTSSGGCGTFHPACCGTHEICSSVSYRAHCPAYFHHTAVIIPPQSLRQTDTKTMRNAAVGAPTLRRP
jgi:hypothetical protein